MSMKLLNILLLIFAVSVTIESRRTNKVRCKSLIEKDNKAATIIVNNQLWKQVEGNLQSLIDCFQNSQESILIFNLTMKLSLTSSILIKNKRKLTLRSLQSATNNQSNVDQTVELDLPEGNILEIKSSRVKFQSFNFRKKDKVVGPVISVDGELKLQDCLFEGFTGEGEASLIKGKKNARVESRDSLFENNRGVVGFAMGSQSVLRIIRNEIRKQQTVQNSFISSRGSVSIERTSFRQNSGRCLSLTDGNFRITESNFTRNSGFSGPVVYVVTSRRDSLVEIKESLFKKNRAEKNGGVLYFSGNGSLTLHNNSFLENTSGGDGGALYSESGSMEITSSIFRNNRAGNLVGLEKQDCPLSLGRHLDDGLSSGGAVFMKSSVHEQDNSSFSCTDCSFVNNTALLTGGSLSLTQMSTLHMTNTEFLSNKARFGGALFIDVASVSPSRQNTVEESIFRDNLGCKGGALYAVDPSTSIHEEDITLQNISFSNNQASLSGNVVYTSYPAPISFLCKTRSADTVLPMNGSFLEMLEEGCGGINLMDESQETELLSEFSTDPVGLKVTPAQVSNHRSGDFLPSLNISLVDAFDQPVLSDGPWISISIQDKENAILQGQKFLNLSQGEGQFNEVLLSALPGDHQLIVASESMLTNLSVSVEDCQSTEIREGLSCTAPSAGSCPDHAVCKGPVIIPEAGYWSPGSSSDEIMKCVRVQSCDRDSSYLLNQVENNSLVIFDWCEDGYEGELCGSCEHDHGHLPGYKCSSCNKSLSSFFAFLVVVYTFFLSLVLIKVSWIADLSPLSDQESLARPQEVEMESVVCEVEVDEPPISQHVEPRNSFGIRGGTLEEARKKIIERSATAPTPSMIITNTPVLHLNHHEPPQAFSPLPIPSLATIDSFEESNAFYTKPFVSECMKIIIEFFQSASLALYSPVEWSREVIGILKTFGLLGAAQSPFYSLDCLFTEDGEIPASLKSFLFVLLLPVGIFTFFSFMWILFYLIVDHSTSVLWQRIENTFVAVFYLAYLPLTHSCFRLLHCQSITGISGIKTDHWIEDTEVECWKGSHRDIVFYLGIPLLIVVSLGLPLCFLVFLLSHKSYGKTERLRSWGLLYEVYKYKRRYWEICVFLRKAVLASIFGFGYHFKTALQSLLALGLFVCFLVIHSIASPYEKKEKRLDRMEILSLFGIMVVFFFATLINILEDRYNALCILLTITLVLIVVQLLGGLSIHLMRSVDWALGEFGREDAYTQPFKRKLILVCNLRLSALHTRFQGLFKNFVGCMKGKCPSFN